nr:metal-sensitive transcriptional regulator [Paenibacillus puerhi]
MQIDHHVNEDASCSHTSSTERKSHHSDKTKQNLINRLNRIEGQVRGVKGMIERDVYCDDILHQIASIQSALNGVGKQLLEDHLKSCVVERIEEGDRDVLDELLTTVAKLMK